MTLAGLLMLAALGALAVVVTSRGPRGGPLGPGTADDVAAAPAGSSAPTATSATMPRIARLRRDLVMSGDLSDDLTAETPGARGLRHTFPRNTDPIGYWNTYLTLSRFGRRLAPGLRRRPRSVRRSGRHGSVVVRVPRPGRRTWLRSATWPHRPQSGGLYAISWASGHPERVCGIYLDNAVCDLRAGQAADRKVWAVAPARPLSGDRCSPSTDSGRTTSEVLRTRPLTPGDATFAYCAAALRALSRGSGVA